MRLNPLPARVSNAHLLVVDDSELNLQYITRVLARRGFVDIQTAYNGMDALEKTYRMPFDLVLLDWRMPELDGHGYCQRVRSDASIPRMPIIVQSALDDRETKLRALSSGADDFVIKPIDDEELNLRVRVHLERYFMLKDTNEVCFS